MPTSPRSVSPLPLDALWQTSTLVWVLLAGEGLAVVLSLAPGVNVDRLVYFGLTSMMVQWVSLLTLAGLYVLRRLLAPLTLHQLAYVALALLVLNTWLVAGAAWYLLGDLWPMTDGSWQALFLRLTVIVLTVGLLGLAAFQNHWRGRLHAVRAKQSELQALQARIRPHFLFNTLNTGAALVHQRPEEAERLLLDLADLFRAALAGPRQILLEDELSLVRRYLEIESLRFGDRLRINWQQPRELPPVTVPALSVQPLVENAIRHGIEHLPGGGDVEVTVTTTVDTVVLRISNPVPRSGPAVPGHQVGLNASQVRIEALTGGRGSVQTQLQGSRFIATVRLPLNTAG
ncbi:sensor histidine kinase [Lysobacter psychrotolerans]|uniref:Sensor histidine kinase n=1 Tax=Montanilutibacter psychrotolerans TaxID=1327343 RepID=A0A3M8SZ91_9GAMM|nr:histidine kinase [Lysobacter psychrotolerans]RNF86539.1 sensor histidine kinase [Lysobacter psychrotolerans]